MKFYGTHFRRQNEWKPEATINKIIKFSKSGRDGDFLWYVFVVQYVRRPISAKDCGIAFLASWLDTLVSL